MYTNQIIIEKTGDDLATEIEINFFANYHTKELAKEGARILKKIYKLKKVGHVYMNNKNQELKTNY